MIDASVSFAGMPDYAIGVVIAAAFLIAVGTAIYTSRNMPSLKNGHGTLNGRVSKLEAKVAQIEKRIDNAPPG